MDIEQIKERLADLGYTCVDGDDFNIQFLMGKCEQYIKHYCNITEIPECLNYVLVDMVAGEFLQVKKATGQLTSIQIEPIVKKIQDGDTTVEYNVSGDSEAIFNTFVDNLINGHETELIRHRKLVW